MEAEKTYMTPSQQREYLNELRKHNAEMYNLNGSSVAAGRDPWAHPVPNPRATRPSQSIDSTNLEKQRGPPKPPKAQNLRNVSTSASLSNERTPNVPLTCVDRPSDRRPEIKNKPDTLRKALPPVPRKPDTSLPDVSRLNLSSSKQRSVLVPDHPNDESRPSVQEPPKKVSISLTNYDIPQIRDFSKSEDPPENQLGSTRKDNMVSIPVFRFDDVGSTSHDTTAKDDLKIPQFQIDLADEPAIVATEAHDADTQTNLGISSSGVTRRRGRRADIPDALARQVRRGLCCANCYETFGRGRVITANNRRYHPIHFVCYECGIPLEHVDFYTHDPEAVDENHEPQGEQHSEVYCHFDYHEHFSPKCRVCETPVIRDGIKALGKTYHAEHFFCALCSQTFSRDRHGDVEFVERDDLAWHPHCYEDKFSETYMCRKCKRKIKAGTQVITMGTGSHFHPECFQCAHCRGSLADGFYWSQQKEGICRPCKEIEVKQDL